jgi:hypothetical protein
MPNFYLLSIPVPRMCLLYHNFYCIFSGLHCLLQGSLYLTFYIFISYLTPGPACGELDALIGQVFAVWTWETIKSELLYDWWFTANQFVMAPSPLRPTMRFLFSTEHLQ